jgi:hypothetical protein
MANLVVTRQVLVLMGCSVAVATAITDEGHNDFDELSILTDDDIDDLCKSIRRPGGTVPGPLLAGGGAGPMIPNPGNAITMRARSNLKLLCYYLRFKQRCSEPFVAPQMTLIAVRALRAQLEQEEAHVDPKAPAITGDDWPKTLDTLREYFGACLGASKIPLGYVIRTDINPTPAPAGGWISNEEIMIARGPIVTNPGVPNNPTYTTDFKVDNKLVWLALSGICKDHDCWTYIRSFQRRQDGRGAFQAHVNMMASAAMNKLQNTVYSGERRRYTWENYVRIHVDQHAILEDLVRHGHSGIDEGSKVRYLMGGIRTTDLEAVRASILGSPTLLVNFTACASLYKSYIDQRNANRTRDRDITIAAVGDEDSGSDGASREHYLANVKPDMTVEERYYNREEYRKLSDEKKAGLIAKRKARGGRYLNRKNKKTGKTDNKDHNDRKSGRGTKGLKLLNRTISKLAVAMRGDTLAPDDDDEDNGPSEESEEEIPMKPPSKKQKIVNNSNNPALHRKKNE